MQRSLSVFRALKQGLGMAEAKLVQQVRGGVLTCGCALWRALLMAEWQHSRAA